MSGAVIEMPRKLRFIDFSASKAAAAAPSPAAVIAFPGARPFREPGAPVPASPVKVFPPKPWPNAPCKPRPPVSSIQEM